MPAKTLDPATVETDQRAYRARRAAERARVVPLRALRRIALGDQVVCEFENADTLAYQVQEMVYTEGITDPAEVAHEVALYSRMLPTSHELCATLLVELQASATVRDELGVLAGLQQAVGIEVGDERVAGVELPGIDGTEPDSTTSSVHVLRFAFTDAARDAFRDPAVPASLVVDHPAYNDDTPISGELRESLLADLALRDS